MQVNFEQSLKYVLIDEGGNSDDPRDHGGRTSRGIIQRNYDAWCSLNGKPHGDVFYATDEDIKSIYIDQYWKPYCDDLPAGVDYLFFDISVNAGRTAAVRQFQKALGVNVDGMMGQVTLNAIKTHSDLETFIRDVSETRRNFYRHLKQFPIYGSGWLHRVDHCERGALAMANNVPYNRPVNPNAMPKANSDEPTSTTVNPGTAGGTAIGTGGLGSLLSQLSTMIEPYKDTIKYVSYALLSIAFVSFGYYAWSLYKNNKTQQAM